jgi:hypothetical protein
MTYVWKTNKRSEAEPIGKRDWNNGNMQETKD